MGIHFDGLVDVVRLCMKEGREIPRPDCLASSRFDIKKYLQGLIFEAALFEFPLDPKDIFQAAKRNLEEYVNYVNDYCDMSARYGKFIVTPFDLTAIEDPVSVVFLDPMGGNKFNTVVFRRKTDFPTASNEIDGTLYMAEVAIRRPEANLVFPVDVLPFYLFKVANSRLHPVNFDLNPGLKHDIATDTVQAAISYIDELVYIMDPANFIIHKENNSSVAERARAGHQKRKDILRKTVMRPHYICLNRDETASYLQDVSTTPLPLQPVAGHWKTLVSQKYVNMRGQKIFVAQYDRGNPDVKGKNGWNYRVMIKEAPDKLSFYAENGK